MSSKALWEAAKSLPEYSSKVIADGFTEHEVKRILQRIGAGMSVSISEYGVAIGWFHRWQELEKIKTKSA